MTTNRTSTIAPATLRRSLGVMAGLMLGLAALPAVAASCETSNVTFSLTQGTGVLDRFCAPGNDTWQGGDVEVFGLTGWAVAQKV